MNPNTIKKRWEREDQAAIDAAFTELLSTYEGRKMLWWLLQVGRFGTQPFTGHALTTAFDCGQLNIGQQIFERITLVSPEGFIQLMKEQADERARRDAELNGSSASDGDDGDVVGNGGGGAE